MHKRQRARNNKLSLNHPNKLMKQNPKIVQIFLAEGTFSGVRTAEIPTKIGSHIIDALEWKCLIEAKDARRYSLVNNVSPSHPFLSVIDIFQNSDRRTKVVEGGRDERETTSQIPQACSFK